MKSFIYTIFCICTAVIGYNIHHSLFWSIMDFIFAPFAWAKWLIFQEVYLSLIQNSFSFFFK